MRSIQKTENSSPPIMASESLDDYDETSSTSPTATLLQSLDTSPVSKNEMTWFASGVALGMIAVVLYFQSQMAGMVKLESQQSPMIEAPVATTPNMFPVLQTGALSPTTALNSQPIVVSFNHNETEPVPVTVGKIAIAEIGFLVAIRAMGIPFRVMAYSARRINIGRRLAIVMNGTKSAKAWHNLIQVYYKTFLSKIVNRSKRFVKIFLPHKKEHEHDEIRHQ